MTEMKDLIREIKKKYGFLGLQNIGVVGGTAWAEADRFIWNGRSARLVVRMTKASSSTPMLAVSFTIMSQPSDDLQAVEDAGYWVGANYFAVDAGYGITEEQLTGHSIQDTQIALDLVDHQLAEMVKAIKIAEGTTPVPRQVQDVDDASAQQDVSGKGNELCSHCNAFQSFMGGLNHEEGCPNKTASIYYKRRAIRASKMLILKGV